LRAAAEQLTDHWSPVSVAGLPTTRCASAAEVSTAPTRSICWRAGSPTRGSPGQLYGRRDRMQFNSGPGFIELTGTGPTGELLLDPSCAVAAAADERAGVVGNRPRTARHRADRSQLHQDRFDAQRYERIRELAAALMAEGANEDPPRSRAVSPGRGYATPKVDVRGAPSGTAGCSWFAKSATAAGRCRRLADVNQSRRMRGARNREESDSPPARSNWRRSMIIAAPPAPPRRVHLQALLPLRADGGSARPSEETSDVAFFARHELPTVAQSHNAGTDRAHVRPRGAPGRPADFD